MDCLFCQIIAGTVQAKVLYRDKAVIAFHDLHPQAPHHILVIPQKHLTTLNELSPEESILIGEVIQSSVKLAKDLGIADKGYRLVMNCNSEGGQTIFHVHMHLLGGRQMHWPPG